MKPVEIMLCAYGDENQKDKGIVTLSFHTDTKELKRGTRLLSCMLMFTEAIF